MFTSSTRIYLEKRNFSVMNVDVPDIIELCFYVTGKLFWAECDDARHLV